MVSVNPNGLVIVGDGEAPRIFTGAVGVSVAVGDFVYVSGTQGTVTSGADSFATTDIVLRPANNPLQVNGIALGSVASGTTNYVSVLRRGDVIVRVIGSLTGGKVVQFVSGTIPGVQSVISGSYDTADIGSIAQAGWIIGRALTDGVSGTNNYALISLNV